MPVDVETLRVASLAGYLLVFLGGVLTSLGPCNLAAIPLIVGYVGGAHDLGRGRAFGLSVTFAVGLAITFMLLGVVAALMGGLIGGSSRPWFYAVAAVCVVLGLQMLGVVRLPAPHWFSGARERVGLRGMPGALALGLVSGLIASGCATPVLAAILTYVMAEGSLAHGATLLFVYALGRGVPVVLAGTFTGAVKRLRLAAGWTAALESASGVLMIGVGLYFVWIA